MPTRKKQVYCQLTKEKSLPFSAFCNSGELQSESKRNRKDRQILEPWLRTKITEEYESKSDTNCSWCTWNGLQILQKRIGGIGNQMKNQNLLDHITVKIG